MIKVHHCEFISQANLHLFNPQKAKQKCYISSGYIHQGARLDPATLVGAHGMKRNTCTISPIPCPNWMQYGFQTAKLCDKDINVCVCVCVCKCETLI